MTHTGARGATAAEIARVLGMPDDRATIAAASQALRKELAAAKGKKIAFEVANRLWVQQGKRLEGEFTGLLEEKFGAGAGIVDFGNATEEARQKINRWVGDRTAKKIDELLKPGVLSPQTGLVLTNAVYMKAAWETPFEKAATAPEPFTLAAGKKADVNVVDFDGLHLYSPKMIFDLPAGGRRLLQGAHGYVATIVSGEVTRRHGVDTGARPGRLVRGAR